MSVDWTAVYISSGHPVNQMLLMAVIHVNIDGGNRKQALVVELDYDLLYWNVSDIGNGFKNLDFLQYSRHSTIIQEYCDKIMQMMKVQLKPHGKCIGWI